MISVAVYPQCGACEERFEDGFSRHENSVGEKQIVLSTLGIDAYGNWQSLAHGPTPCPQDLLGNTKYR